MKKPGGAEQIFSVVDYETYSELDLGEVGAYEYCVHPSTEILCAAWKTGTRKELKNASTQGWCGLLGVGRSAPLKTAVADSRIYKVAHNAGFDRLVSVHVLRVRTSIDDWLDSAAQAATHALPRDLERACEVLELKHQKNPEGAELKKALCWPRKATKKNPETRDTDPAKLKRFLKYCMDDVDAATELFLTLPPLTPTERKIWKMNARFNARGICTDQKLIGAALRMIAAETIDLDKRTRRITGGVVERMTQVARVKDFLIKHDCALPDLRKETVEHAIASGLAHGKAKQVLEIRQSISMTSTAKYAVARARTRSDGRLRDIQMYHGASTGRDIAMGFQLHNLPKPTVECQETAVASVLTGDREWVRAVSGDVMKTVSTAVRGVLVASPGQEMFAGDFNAVEARILNWEAQDFDGMAAFDRGDPYKDAAADVFGVPVSRVTDDQRQFGKAIELGSGFQMGDGKMYGQCLQKNIPDVTKELCTRGIQSYRRRHKKIVRLWYDYENAAIRAVATGRPQRVNFVTFYTKGNFLYVRLPSGRDLAFFKPVVRHVMTPWGDKRPKLYFLSVNPRTHQWVLDSIYGGQWAENITQAIARDLMKQGELRVEALGYTPLFDVHDEVVTERKKGEGAIEEFEMELKRVPEWAPGLSIKVKAWKGPRYKKA